MENKKVEYVFADGLGFEKPHEKVAKFITTKMSVNVDRFIKFLQDNKNERGFANFDIRYSEQKDKHYATLNNFNSNMPVAERKEVEMTKELQGATPLNTPDTDTPEDEINPLDIPF